MRLIDADALAKFIDYGHLNNPNDKLYSENDIREMIDMMPTVDAEPVVRCKECKYGDYDALFGNWWCKRIRDDNGWHKLPNWFCADGERGTDEQQE